MRGHVAVEDAVQVFPPPDFLPVNAIITTVSLDADLVRRGASRDYVEVRVTQIQSFPDDPGMPDEVIVQEGAQGGDRAWLPRANAVGVTAADVPGRWGLMTAPWDPAQFAGTLQTDIYDLAADGTGIGELSGRSVTWSVSGDTLLIQRPGGAVDTHLLLQSITPGAQAVNLLDSTGAAPERQGFYVAKANGASLDASTLPGFYFQTDRRQPWRAPFYWEFLAGGTGFRHSEGAFSSFAVSNPLFWEFELDGTLLIRRVFNFSFGFVDDMSCLATDDCFVFSERRWRALALDGDQLFVHETLEFFNFDPAGPDNQGSHLINTSRVMYYIVD